jgi:hypothetical protein
MPVRVKPRERRRGSSVTPASSKPRPPAQSINAPATRSCRWRTRSAAGPSGVDTEPRTVQHAGLAMSTTLLAPIVAPRRVPPGPRRRRTQQRSRAIQPRVREVPTQGRGAPARRSGRADLVPWRPRPAPRHPARQCTKKCVSVATRTYHTQSAWSDHEGSGQGAHRGEIYGGADPIRRQRADLVADSEIGKKRSRLPAGTWRDLRSPGGRPSLIRTRHAPFRELHKDLGPRP